MTTLIERSRTQSRERLRAQAEQVIREGADAVADLGGGALGVEALKALYSRATDPEFAADALKLLHELKTHQVELDLVLEQVLTREKEATEDLAYYRALYALAPAAYLVMTRDGRVLDRNDAAARQLGIPTEYSADHTLTQYLSPLSRTAFAAMLEALETAPESAAGCLVRTADHPESVLAVKARLGPAGDSVFVLIFQLGDTSGDITVF